MQSIEMKLELSGVGVLSLGFGIRKAWLEIGVCGAKVANSSFCNVQVEPSSTPRSLRQQ